jgi:hypothetical protein
MPDAKTVEVANAVTARLNLPATFSQAFTAVRAWDVSYDLEELATLRVTVVAARTEDEDDESRGCRAATHEIQVGVQKRVDVASLAVMNAMCDGLAYLAQQIGDHFASEDADDAMAAATGVRHLSGSIALYDPLMLREKHVFLSAVTLRFREWRDR